MTDYHVHAQSDWLHRYRLSIDIYLSAPGAGQSLKMASTSRFREDSEDVSQSAFPEKTKNFTNYVVKIFKGKCRNIYTIYSLTVICRQNEPTKKKSLEHQILFLW